LSPLTGLSKQVTEPDVGCRVPETRFSIVDLPQPDGPITTRISPFMTVRSMWSRTAVDDPPKRRLTSSSLMATSCSDGPEAG
jgi:hypothetical protein